MEIKKIVSIFAKWLVSGTDDSDDYDRCIILSELNACARYEAIN